MMFPNINTIIISTEYSDIEYCLKKQEDSIIKSLQRYTFNNIILIGYEHKIEKFEALYKYCKKLKIDIKYLILNKKYDSTKIFKILSDKLDLDLKSNNIILAKYANNILYNGLKKYSKKYNIKLLDDNIHSNKQIINKINTKIEYNKNFNELFKILFNEYQYESLRLLLYYMNINYEDKCKIEEVINFYDNLEKFDFSKKEIPKINKLPSFLHDIEDQYNKNIDQYNLLRKDKELYLIISLINSSKRKFQLHEYNECIIRMYRVLEAIGHLRLKKHGIDSKNINENNLKEKGVNNYYINNLEHSADNIISLSLLGQYNLLNKLNDPIGHYFKDNFEFFEELVFMRHSSVLVHGNTTISAIQYKHFEYLLIELFKLFNKNIKSYLLNTEFPQFPYIAE